MLPTKYREEHLAELRQAGIDVKSALETRQLEVAAPQDTYLRGGHFSKDAMLALIQEALKTGPGLGFQAPSLLASMVWMTS